MVLVLAVHSVQSVTAKVPFSMVALLDLVKKHELPPDVKCRQVFPTSGLRSTSLWDVPSLDSLQIWLDEYLDVDCTNEVFEVQEDFAFGISADLARQRATERITTSGRAVAAAVSERTRPATEAASQQMNEFDSKYHVTEQTSAAFKAAQDRSRLAAQNAAAAVSKMSMAARSQYTKALQNERIAAMTSSANSTAGQIGAQLSAGWKSLGANIPSWKAGSGQGSSHSPSAEGSPGTDTSFHSREPGHVAPAAASAAARQPAKPGLAGDANALAQPPAAPVPKTAGTRSSPAPSSASQAKEGDSLFTLDDLDGGDDRSAHELPAGSLR